VSLRLSFLGWCREQLGATVLWAAKGPKAFDCSGFVTCGLRYLGGPDWTLTHNTDRLWAELEPAEEEHVQPGDFAFWYAPDPTPMQVAAGADPRPAAERGDVEHVAVMASDGKVITADGATHRITDLEAAFAAGARVRVRDSVHYRPRFAGWRKFPLVSGPDGKPVLACEPSP
jgi:cell wall-associated NlpC family hydrolase